MKPNKSIRFDEGQLEQLQELAASKELSLGGVVRHACDLLLLKEGLAVELDSMESRLAAGLNRTLKEVSRTQDDVQLLIALVDQLTRFMLTATPEVIDKETAAAVGNRRHAAFLQDLHKAFSTSRRRSVLSEKLNSMEGEDNGS